METTSKRLLEIIVGFTLTLLLTGATALAAQDDCQPSLDAMSKVFDTPSHSYVTTNMGGKIQTGEVINAAGRSYTKAGDKWAPSLISLKEIQEQKKKNMKNNMMTCRYLKDESVNGENAAVYSVHEESPRKVKTDSQVWISKSKGLLLRSEIDLGPAMHVSTRVEYGNVKAPM